MDLNKSWPKPVHIYTRDNFLSFVNKQRNCSADEFIVPDSMNVFVTMNNKDLDRSSNKENEVEKSATNGVNNDLEVVNIIDKSNNNSQLTLVHYHCIVCDSLEFNTAKNMCRTCNSKMLLQCRNCQQIQADQSNFIKSKITCVCQTNKCKINVFKCQYCSYKSIKRQNISKHIVKMHQDKIDAIRNKNIALQNYLS